MSKSVFNLQKAQFSDSDEETPIQLSSNTITAYNRQYSMIYQQISTFLKECKDNIFKYISLNQFGIGFNICNIFSQINKIQTSLLQGISDVEKQQLDHKKSLKNKYQIQFENLIERMGNVIQDFLKFQVEFKRQYFGFNMDSSRPKSAKKRNMTNYTSPGLRKIGSQHSVKSGSSLRRKLLSSNRESQQKKQSQIQQKLRDILKRKLVPQKQNIIKFCDKATDPAKNLSKLQQKIDMMQSQMILSKNREQKIIQIFNKRRIQNIQPKGQQIIHSQLIEPNQKTKMNQNQSYSTYKINESINNYQSKRNDDEGSSRKRSIFSKPVLDFQAIECPKYPEKGNQKTACSTNYGTNVISSPKKLISPKGFKTAKEGGMSSTFLFFNSPKNVNLTKKGHINKSPGDFKKKKQNQIQQQNNLSQQNIEDKAVKIGNIDRLDNKNQDVVQNSSKTNNRSMFMRRRSNNQALQSGVSSLIEKL